MSHQEFIEVDRPGGTRPKYPGGVYRVDFQIGQDEPLEGPVALDFPHYQLPVSIYRSHMSTGGLFGLGSMPEVLSLQQDLEWWQKCRMDHAHYSARPPFLVDTEAIDRSYYNPKTLLKQILTQLRRGFRVIPLRGSPNRDPVQFAKIGTFSTDVERIIDRIEYRISEIIGPTPTMRGNVSGEVSGKAFAMRRESAAKPITDTLSIIEGPLQKHFERMVLNILEFSPLEKIEQISGPEGAQAIEWIRENMPDFRCAVNVDLGTGMPTDWHTKAEMEMQLLQLGLVDPKQVERDLKLPIALQMPAMPEQPAPQGQGASM